MFGQYVGIEEGAIDGCASAGAEGGIERAVKDLETKKRAVGWGVNCRTSQV
jgi:hypothetical protein